MSSDLWWWNVLRLNIDINRDLRLVIDVFDNDFKLSPLYLGYNKLRNLLLVLGECKVWWLTFGVTMVFFVGYPLFKSIW